MLSISNKHSENYYLQAASNLVSKGEVGSAIQLLVEASAIFQDSTRIINALGKLYLKTNRPQEVAAYFEKALKINIEDEAPTEEDFNYLSEQAESLIESEYSYDEPSEYTSSSEIQKTTKLSLRNGEGNSGSKYTEIKKTLVKHSDGLIKDKLIIELSVDI